MKIEFLISKTTLVNQLRFFSIAKHFFFRLFRIILVFLIFLFLFNFFDSLDIARNVVVVFFLIDC